jgi:hypothetical protein
MKLFLSKKVKEECRLEKKKWKHTIKKHKKTKNKLKDMKVKLLRLKMS